MQAGESDPVEPLQLTFESTQPAGGISKVALDECRDREAVVPLSALMPPLISVKRCTEKKNRETGSGFLKRLEITSLAFE
jgi:hypothetical protein